jgi:hypothetical protein
MFSGSEWLIVVIVLLLVVVVPVLLIVGFVAIGRRSKQSARLMRAAPMPSQPLPPPSGTPGWYPDPTGAVGQRFWNGQAWTDQTQPPPAEVPT